MRFSTATVFATLAAFAAAYTQPDYSKPPVGNPIAYPGLDQQVPVGKPFEIKWTPNLGSTISLVLLRGPSSNVVPLETIVENIPNTGSYMWTPGANLTPDTTHYGILLVVEGTGQYQWSTQFGISKADGSDTTTTASATATATSEPKPPAVTNTSAATTTAAVSYSTLIPSTVITTTICPETTAAATTVPVSSSSLTRRPATSSTPASAATSAVTPSSTPVFNGAGRTTASFGAVVGAIFAVMAL